MWAGPDDVCGGQRFPSAPSRCTRSTSLPGEPLSNNNLTGPPVSAGHLCHHQYASNVRSAHAHLVIWFQNGLLRTLREFQQP